MIEILFFVGAIIVYLYSFLYKNLAIFATVILFVVAYKMKVDVVLIALTISFLVVMRLRQNEIKDDL